MAIIRDIMPAFELFQPATVGDALGLLDQHGSDAWVRRARDWTEVMFTDAVLSLNIYTLSTVAMFIMGAAVLDPQSLDPQGKATITTLARMYTNTLGA